MTDLKHLFAPIRIGGLTARNRLMMSAMSINFGVDDKGHPTDQLIAYLTARARGGVGLLQVGGGAVHPSGLELPDLPKLWRDDCIPSLARLTRAVRPHGALFGMQLMHGGRQSYHDHKVAPSAIRAPAVVKSAPRALALGEIAELVAAFGDAARRCREAGFDFVEIHGAHGYLVNQFLAPNANRRQDRYGGSFDNRIRFLLELMAAIRENAGADFPVGVRINGEDYIDNGWGLEEACRLAPILESVGAAYLHVSAGVYGSKVLTIPSMYVAPGCFVHLAEAVKAHVTIPVVGVGRIKDPCLADAVIADGRADMVAMGRALLADPELPNKAREGRFEAIRPCIGCCLACIHRVLALESGSCVVNPAVGREHLLERQEMPATPKTVLVVGGGVAGMAAARLAAMRGHSVTLAESGDRLGGLGRLAAVPPGRGEILDIVDFFKREIARLGIGVRLNRALDAGLLDEVDPTDVVLATGSRPDFPLVRGLSQTRLKLVTGLEVLGGEAQITGRVAVLGGGQAALVVADHLAESGAEVVVLNRGRHFAEEMAANDRYSLRERLNASGTRLVKKVRLKQVTDTGVVFQAGGQEETFDGLDALVISEKMTPIRKSLELLRGREVTWHLIGDAKSPRILMYAISEGEEVGLAL
jgi:2,4-dienoyl-CoA reductase-like NADH-dependent reductase (Old Yellow Enzyme family)